ncbi:unnamed protein product [Mytilus edulis]|uniref:Uncharacterized protein n=1 Tax=Mytilus edulis TaxID=6550 RepID=A0A8S3RRU3_MYTED|nr:unnamed protein product [Mytilus edulis]
MASKGQCDPCTEQGTSSPAVKFCSDCEERTCFKECKKFSSLKRYFRCNGQCFKTLTGLMDGTNNNIKKLEDDEQTILRELQNVKENLVKQIDKLEEKVIKELSSIKKEKEIKFKRNKTEIGELKAKVQEIHEQVNFLKEHGSNSQLFWLCGNRRNKFNQLMFELKR